MSDPEVMVQEALAALIARMIATIDHSGECVNYGAAIANVCAGYLDLVQARDSE